MSAVNEWIVREYFEQLGYFVNQPRKHVVPGRQKGADEEVDLVVLHPHIGAQPLPEAMVWGREELKRAGRAVVAVRGWHTERFYASTFEQTPELLRFVEEDALRCARQWLGEGPVAKILCLPRLPATAAMRDRCLDALRERGVDGVLEFRTMLQELVSQVETQRNYEKSDLLQIIRVLKSYDMLREPQLELFARKTRRKKA
jgi:hypothetical protein